MRLINPKQQCTLGLNYTSSLFIYKSSFLREEEHRIDFPSILNNEEKEMRDNCLHVTSALKIQEYLSEIPSFAYEESLKFLSDKES